MVISRAQRSPLGAYFRSPLGVRSTGTPDPYSDGWHIVAQMGLSGTSIIYGGGFFFWDGGSVGAKMLFGGSSMGSFSGSASVHYPITPTLGGVPYLENYGLPHRRRLVITVDASWNVTVEYFEQHYGAGDWYGWSYYMESNGTLTKTMPITGARPAPVAWYGSIQLVQWSGSYTIFAPLTPFNSPRVYATDWSCEGFSDSFGSGVGGDWTQVGEDDWVGSDPTTNGMDTSGSIGLPAGVEGEIYWSTSQTSAGDVTTQVDFFNNNSFGTGGYQMRVGLHEWLDWWGSSAVAYDSAFGGWK